MRISDWSSDVCSSDLPPKVDRAKLAMTMFTAMTTPKKATRIIAACRPVKRFCTGWSVMVLSPVGRTGWRSEEHTSELQSLMRISYAVLCLTKKKNTISEKSILKHTIRIYELTQHYS